MNNAAVIAIVEDEPIHEFYASLVGTSHRKCVAVSRPETLRGTAASATSGGIVLTSLSNINNPNILIPKICDDCHPAPSSSQFITFYRKSCREAQQCWGGKVKSGGKQKIGHQLCSRDKPSSSQSGHLKSELLSDVKNSRAHSARTKKVHATTTKSERKRLAKREHERYLQKERRIRMMLRMDISEKDELLFMRLNR